MGDHLLSQGIVMADFARQLERELAQAQASVENYASAAEELRREVNELRAELARIQGQTRWECTCGGTDCEGRKENERLRGLIQRILDYPYLPQKLATIIRKELENEQR